MPPQPHIKGIYRDDMRARAAYSEGAGIYRIVPRAVALPRDQEDLIGLVCWAADHRVPLIPRGAGSAMGGGNVGSGVIIDLTRMVDQRVEVHPAARRAETGAGLTLSQLNAAGGQHGLRLPPDPSSGAWATLGGMIATNAAGARSLRYGSVRRWVESLTLVTVDGETVRLDRGSDPPSAAALDRFSRQVAPGIERAAAQIQRRFPHTRKNSSGYALDAFVSSGDVIDLLIGSEGTLGIVTQIGWRLDPVPAVRAGVRASFRSTELLGDAVHALQTSRPSAIELLDRTFLDLVTDDTLAGAGARFSGAEAVLLVEFEREDSAALRGAVEDATARLRPIAHAVDSAFTPQAAERLWSIRHAASPILARLPEQRRSLQVIEDACVPLPHLSRYIQFVRGAAASHAIPVVIFGHAGDGHLHVNLLPEVGRPGWDQEVAALLEEVTDEVIALGGTPSGEHGDGRLRAHTLERVFGSEIVALFRGVKHSFDPAGILNPGIIIPSGQPPISQLKVGAGAAPLPEDIRQSLREIERMAGYGRSRLELAGESGVGSQGSGA